MGLAVDLMDLGADFGGFSVDVLVDFGGFGGFGGSGLKNREIRECSECVLDISGTPQ